MLRNTLDIANLRNTPRPLMEASFFPAPEAPTTLEEITAIDRDAMYETTVQEEQVKARPSCGITEVIDKTAQVC